jgi:predicted metal-dependent HD superfamily phosphohydrolase
MNRRKQLQAVRDLVWQDMPWKEYHNPLHADDVSQTAGRFARLMGMDEELVHLEETAGLIHDVIHVTGAADNEEQSAAYGKLHLPSLGYKPWEIDIMSDMIVSGTKMPHNPTHAFAKILADADVFNAGRSDFLMCNDMLRGELGLPATRSWYEGSLKFLQSINWYTEPARQYGEANRQRNIEQLYEILEQYKAA